MALVKGIVKSVLSVSCGVVCGGVCCLTIFALGTATMRVTVFVSGLVIFLLTLLRCYYAAACAQHQLKCCPLCFIVYTLYLTAYGV
jgi:hypothetical protein